MTLSTHLVAANTTLTHLRERLDEIERLFVVMHETPAGVISVLQLYDQIEGLIEAARAAQLNIEPEANRADFMQRQIINRAPKIIQLATLGDHMAELTTSRIGRLVLDTAAERRRTQKRQLLTAGAVVVGVLVLFFGVLPALFPPTPIANTNNVARLAVDGDLEGALAYAREEQLQYPDDAELLIWIGVLEQQQGTGDAELAPLWERARSLYGNDASFYFTRGNLLLQLNNLDAATADGLRLTQMEEAAAYGHLILGGVAEQRGDLPGAVAEFERATQLAEANGDSQLQVMARVRLGLLLQSAPPAATESPAP
ncbi:MAG TPA: hypothetical protein PKA05_04100 [Roseiflexaceae bacterium]|nr:hypothetical protein [Roseiflexaceae bacterium]HMP39543.1 hypothetical protein [Roseiflexaceae bacterium]